MPVAEEEGGCFLSAVILAAGSSTRMGRPKQLLPVGDRPLLQHVLDAAVASCLDEVILVLGHRAEEIGGAIRLPSSGRVRVVINPNYGEGQSTSLQLGLRSTDGRSRAAAVLLGDQPGVSARLVDRVAETFRTSASPLVRPVYAGSGGRPIPGHPVLIARRIWPEVETLRWDRGARELLSVHPEWLLEIPVEGEAPGDIDTREDYLRAVGASETMGGQS